MPLKLYQEQAIKRNVPIFIGIGVSQIDCNSIADISATKEEIKQLSLEYIESIKKVAKVIHKNGYKLRKPHWPEQSILKMSVLRVVCK